MRATDTGGGKLEMRHTVQYKMLDVRRLDLLAAQGPSKIIMENNMITNSRRAIVVVEERFNWQVVFTIEVEVV